MLGGRRTILESQPMSFKCPKRVAWRPLSLLVLYSFTSTGCELGTRSASPPQTGTEPQQGGTLVAAVPSDMAGVNQLLAGTDTFSQAVIDRMFLHLFEEQPDYTENPPTFRPRLVESSEWSEDRRQLTLYLRRDVHWSDGVPVTADDVRWTWQAQVHPDIAWGYAQSKQIIVDMEVVDPHIVRVLFDRPSASPLSGLNEGVILPKHAWERLPFSEWRDNAEWFVEHLVVNGPFTLESWQKQEHVVLRRNAAYFESPLPYLDSVVFRIVPQKANQIGQLLAGAVDYVEQIPPAEAARLEASEKVQLIRYWTRQYNFVCWNTSRHLFAEAETRRALTLAIDRRELIEALWFGGARVASSPIISTVWAHNDSLQPWPYDPQEARRILADSGWIDSDGDGVLDKEGKPFSFELITNTGSKVRVDAAILIQEQLRRAGIAAKVRHIEFNTMIARSLAHDFDALLSGWSIDTSLDLTYAFHTDSIDGGYNFGSYSHPEVDRLIDQARETVDIAQKSHILGEIQAILHAEQPYTFLWEPERMAAASARLQAAQPNPLSTFFRLREWWLTPSG
jgi:peptide/nickel transport system substrate-binding protein